MAIAKYFSKDLLAINQVLKSDYVNLDKILTTSKVGIAFSDNASQTIEGRKALDLTVRILSRLYPNLSIKDLSGKNDKFTSELKYLSKSINNEITFTTSDDLDVLVIAGMVDELPVTRGRTVFIGSDNWIAKFSSTNPIGFNNSDNPFGCGIAACLGASNVFRILFREFLNEDKEIDKEVNFSPISFDGSNLEYNPALTPIYFGDVVLVGVGAIGNGVVWALANNPFIKGKLDVVDHEEVSISNLQRYVMLGETHVGQSKVKLLSELLSKSQLSLSLYQSTWEGYLKQRDNWQIKTVAVAIDNKKDRIKIQSALPKKVFNSYTESNLIGIARHLDFLKSACMACGYIPYEKEKNYTQEVADNCNIPTLSNLVKDYINLNLGVDSIIQPQNTASLLDVIAQANRIPREQLLQFHGKKVNQFYSEFVCGGISLSLSNVPKKITTLDAPLAFQSAMAGILLAAELIIDENQIRRSAIKQQSHIYPLNRISNHNPFNHALKKDNSTRCICADEDFKLKYLTKWSSEINK